MRLYCSCFPEGITWCSHFQIELTKHEENQLFMQKKNKDKTSDVHYKLQGQVQEDLQVYWKSMTNHLIQATDWIL